MKLEPNSSRPSCYVVEFLSNLDPSFRSFHMDTMCDDLANKTDVMCRIYMRQLGLNTELEREACGSNPKDLVPKIVYFVTFGSYTFNIWNYIAVLAAQRHVQPTGLYVVGDQHPVGPWWELTLRDVPGLRFVYRQAPTVMSGKKITIIHQKSDIVRLQLLYMNGGIYLDVDQVVLRSLDSLLVYNVSLGLLNEATGMGNAFIAAKRWDSFLRDWYLGYKDFQNNTWGYNSMKVSKGLYLTNKSRVNLITELIYRPQFWELPLLLNESVAFDWRKNYAMHVWTAHGKLPKTIQEIQTGNSTVLQVFRYIIYGDPRPRADSIVVPQMLQ
ncbi:serine/threonine-protein kinase Chk1 [Biomphalaria glabrata]|nr:serine/threonine-protein kinase Chk1 [Biomphalaria glabrata]